MTCDKKQVTGNRHQKDIYVKHMYIIDIINVTKHV